MRLSLYFLYNPAPNTEAPRQIMSEEICLNAILIFLNFFPTLTHHSTIIPLTRFTGYELWAYELKHMARVYPRWGIISKILGEKRWWSAVTGEATPQRNTHTHTHTNPHTHTHTHNRGKFVLWDPHLHADNRQRTSTAALPQFVLVPSRRHDARLVASELGVPNQIFERVGQLGDIGGQNY
jgi:hypothetical protein